LQKGGSRAQVIKWASVPAEDPEDLTDEEGIDPDELDWNNLN
jgi:hypothetical protein